MGMALHDMNCRKYLPIFLFLLVGVPLHARTTEIRQNSGQQSPSAATSQDSESKTGSSSSHRTVHHVRIEEEEPPDPDLTRAESLIEKKDYAEAAPLLQKVVDRTPSNYAAWFDLGFTLNALGKTEDSIAAYRKSVAAKPSAFEPNLNLGLQLAKTGQPDAEQYLRAATQLKPTAHVAEGQERAWLSLAEILQKSKPEDALNACRQASALVATDPEPHLIAGRLLEDENKYADAEQEYKQAYALDPSADALTGLANIYMRGHRFPEAEQYLRLLVAKIPQDAAAHVQLGRVLAAEGKNDEAMNELKAGAQLAPDDMSVQRDLAEVYTSTGNYDLAEIAYRRLLSAHPNDGNLHQLLGRTLLREKKYPEAQQELLIAVKLKPDLGEAYGDLAFAAGENKEYPLVLKALDVRAKFLPEIPITYFLRASAFDHLRDYKQAALNYHLFLKTADGKFPDQEWQAQHRLITIEPKK